MDISIDSDDNIIILNYIYIYIYIYIYNYTIYSVYDKPCYYFIIMINLKNIYNYYNNIYIII